MGSEADFRDSGIEILENLLADAEQGDAAESVLFDSVTHLPRLNILLKDIQAKFHEHDQVGILSLNISPFIKLEEMFGWETYDSVLLTIAETLREIKTERLRDGDTVAELSMSGNSFVFVLSSPRFNRYVTYDDLDMLRGRIYKDLDSRLAAKFPGELVEQFGCFIGCSVITNDPDVGLDHQILRGLHRAYSDAFQERERGIRARMSRLEEIIDQGRITSVYQPIVDLKTEEILAYEALSRGPEGEFAKPEYMFKIAQECKLLWKLERLCRSRAIEGAAALPDDCFLFMNIEPDSVFDPKLPDVFKGNFLAKRVVLEITERAVVGDYVLLKKALNVIREIGLHIAIDDVGAGYAGLRLIGEVEPRFVKLDMNFTRGIEKSEINRQLVKVMVYLAETIGTALLVEGVETDEELAVMRELGVRYAQGFLFGRPEAEPRPVDFKKLKRIDAKQAMEKTAARKAVGRARR